MDDDGPLLVDLENHWARLGDDERRVLVWIAKRLARGRAQYGELDLGSDKRDWRREFTEEVLDALVYAACEAVKGRATRDG